MPKRPLPSLATDEEDEQAALLASLAPAIEELQKCWQTAALAQFYSIIVGAPLGSPTGSVESLERTLAQGEETTLVGLSCLETVHLVLPQSAASQLNVPVSVFETSVKLLQNTFPVI